MAAKTDCLFVPTRGSGWGCAWVSSAVTRLRGLIALQLPFFHLLLKSGVAVLKKFMTCMFTFYDFKFYDLPLLVT